MARGRAKLAMSQGMSLWVLEAPDGFGEAGFHAHHALQITFSLSGSLVLSTTEETVDAPSVAVAADARHRFEAQGLLVFIFIEPESRAGRALAETLFREKSLADLGSFDRRPIEQLRFTFEHGLSNRDLLEAGEAMVADLVPGIEPVLPDPRVQRIIDHAAANLDQPLSLADCSAGVYLSPSRLRHLFVEQTGLPFKTYLLWLRLVRAIDVYSAGRTLTEAAHEAGFADSAHFSRVFKKTFGLPATTLERV